MKLTLRDVEYLISVLGARVGELENYLKTPGDEKAGGISQEDREVTKDCINTLERIISSYMEKYEESMEKVMDLEIDI